MSNAKNFPFDADAMTEFFKANDFTKMFADGKMPSMDPSAMMAAQQANMQALVEANKAATAGFQDMFKKQVSLFEQAMEEAKKTMTNFDPSKMTPDHAASQAEVMKAAYEKAMAHMSELTDSAQKANKDAFEIVSARMKASMAELQTVADSAKK